jgi:CheY-like chemotaxis protein
MPDLDGFGFLDGLNSLPEEQLTNIQIIILTSSNSQTDFEKAFSYGRVIHFITKPLKQADLQLIQDKIKPWR